MYGLLSRAAPDAATRSARSVLAALMGSFGAAGLVASAGRPQLLAAVDQHAAAIRDSLRDAQSSVSAPALAGYVEGLQDAAKAHGQRPSVAAIDWADPDWVSTRLLAVCALARACGSVVETVPPPADERPAAA